MSTAADSSSLLPEGSETPFADIESAIAAAHPKGQAPHSPRALTATVVAIGATAELQERAGVLEQLGQAGGVRAILISEGDRSKPAVRVSDNAVALIGLKSEFLDNAVAALRLSSLPTVVWWRGGSPDALERLAYLADRLVLDVDDPSPVWRRVPALARNTAVSDLRWTRLTRWRALMAHFFDAPGVAAARFQTLEIETADSHAGRLFGGWLKSSLRWKEEVRIDVRDAADGAPLRRVRLAGPAQELTLTLRTPSRTCVEAAARIEGRAGASRIVSLGDQSVAALIAEELRIRSRDLVFEKAVGAL